MNEDQAALLFAALSNVDRLKIVRALVEAGPGGMAAGEIAHAIGGAPSRTSFHLNALTQSGVIERKRKSRHVNYRVSFAKLGALIAFIMEDCCRGNAQLKTCSGF